MNISSFQWCKETVSFLHLQTNCIYFSIDFLNTYHFLGKSEKIFPHLHYLCSVF